MVKKLVTHKVAVAAGANTTVVPAPVGAVDTVYIAVTPGAASDKGALVITDVLSGITVLTQATTTPGTFHPRGDAIHTNAGAPVASTNAAPTCFGQLSVALSSASDVTALEVAFVIDA